MCFCCVLASTARGQSAGLAPSVERLYSEAQTIQSRGDTQAAIAKYEEIRRVAPRLAPACNNLGALYYDAGQYHKSIEVLQAGLRIDSKMASSYAIMGEAYLSLGNYAQAVISLKSAVKLNPKDQRSEDLLEQSLITTKQFDLAVERIKIRVQSNAEDQNAWYRLGNLYLLLSQQAHARAIAIKPDSAISYDLEGEIREGMGNLKGAQAKFELAVKADPDKPGTHDHLGNVLWVQGQWSAAQKEFEAEIANDGNNCHARWKLANCMLNQNANPQSTLDILDETITRCPDLMQARVDRARTLIQLQRTADGLDDLLLAKKENPEEPQIHFLLAKVYRARGLTAEAAEEMRLFGILADQNKHIPNADASAGSVPDGK